jgi:hypothetical protein
LNSNVSFAGGIFVAWIFNFLGRKRIVTQICFGLIEINFLVIELLMLFYKKKTIDIELFVYELMSQPFGLPIRALFVALNTL